jgi:hypothetical protein
MKRQTLRDDNALLQFANTFTGRGGAEIPLEYLRRSKVRAFFVGDQMVGGYVCNTSAPFRYLDWIPEVERSSIPELLNPGDLCELTCLWVARNHQKSKSTSLIIFTSACIDGILAWRKYTIGGSLLKIVRAMQIQAFPNEIYHGPTPAGRECWVYYATWPELFTHYLKTMIVGFWSNLFGTPQYMKRARKSAKQARS